MFKIKKIEALKQKAKQLKIMGITIAVVFVMMFTNIIYLNVKVAQLSGAQEVILKNL